MEVRTTHVIRANLLSRASGPAASLVLRTNITPANIYPSIYIPPSGDACFFSAGNVDAMTIVESFAQDRTEIERLVGFAQDRVINGKTIPKPVTYAETSSHHDILKLLDDVADDNIPLGIPVPRKTNPIPLIWWNRQTHRTSGLPLVPRGRDRA